MSRRVAPLISICAEDSPAVRAAIEVVSCMIFVCGGSNSISPAVIILSEAPITIEASLKRLRAAIQTVTVFLLSDVFGVES